MQCFTLTEEAVPFLRGFLYKGREPLLMTPDGCNVEIALGKEFTQQLTEAAELWPKMTKFTVTGFKLGFNPDPTRPLSAHDRRVGVELELEVNALIVKPSAHRHSRRSKEQALVRIQTMAVPGGKVWLTSNACMQELKNGRVEERFEPFPSVGVEALCDSDTLKRVNSGVEELDLFVILQPGARFRIQRSGETRAAEVRRTISVCWTGTELYPIHPVYDPRLPHEGIFKVLDLDGRTSADLY